MHGVAYYTTAAGANAAVDAIVNLKEQDLRVKPLQDYLF